MDEQVSQLFDQAIGRAESIYRVRLTPQARRLLSVAVDSIVDEEAQRWRVGRDEVGHTGRREAQMDVVYSLPIQLAIAARFAPDRQVTAFVLMHQLSGIIERLCPFEKPS